MFLVDQYRKRSQRLVGTSRKLGVLKHDLSRCVNELGRQSVGDDFLFHFPSAVGFIQYTESQF